MPLATTRGFVLGSTVVNEQDRLVQLFTEEKGVIRAVAPGAMRPRNRFGSLFELFTEGEFFYYWQENRELITISRGEILHSYFNMVSDPGNIFYFYLMADVFLHFIPFNHKDQRLYRLMNSILESRSSEIPMNLLMLYFLVWVLRIEGMMFKPGLCYNCYSRDLDEAWFKADFQGMLCRNCRSNESISLITPELSFLQWTEKNPPKLLEKWTGKIDTAKMIRSFTRKMQFHGECPLKSTQYLPEFR